MKARTELKCYALGISTDEMEYCIDTDEKRAALPTELKGFLGVHPDGLRGMIYFLYLTKKHRDAAFKELEGKYETLYFVRTPAFVDMRYLQKA